MRAGSAWRYGVGVAAAVVAAVGLVAGQEGPAASSAAPAPAPAVADRSRLVVGMPDEVRYLTPAGEQIARLTADGLAKAAGPSLAVPTRSSPVGPVPVLRVVPIGRLTPDGRLPVLTEAGTRFVRPGPPVAVEQPTTAAGRPVFPVGTDGAYLAAWSADGTRAVGCRVRSRLLLGDALDHTVTDLAAGTTTPLPVPDGHHVVDWSADGAWFLTVRTQTRFNPFAASEAVTTPCRVSRDGKAVEELAPKAERVQQAAFSPDGKRVAYLRTTADGGVEAVVLDVAAGARRVAAAEPGGENRVLTPVAVRWSPDGTRVGYAFVAHLAGDRPGIGMRAATCAAAGGDRREVFALDTGPGARDFPAGFTLFDWR